jgi:hypothetical protein
MNYRQTLMKMPSLGITSAVTLSYFAFYTGYSKQTKALSLKSLTDVFIAPTSEVSLDEKLVQINKAVSLSGLTVMMMSYLPYWTPQQGKEMLFHSMSMLWIHSAYSFQKFYQADLTKIMKKRTMEISSVIMGVAGQLALSAGYWGDISEAQLVAASVILGVGHFYTMELDYKYVLQVRPYAYLPFPLSVATLYSYFFGK